MKRFNPILIALILTSSLVTSFAAQGDSTLLMPFGPQSLDLTTPNGYADLNGPQGNFANSEYNAYDILYHQAVILSDANSSGGQSLERVDKIGGTGLVGRGGISEIADAGTVSGYFFTTASTSGRSGKPFFNGFPSDGALFKGTTVSRGWSLVRYRGLKLSTTSNGISASYNPFPYRLRSKAIALPNLNLESMASNSSYPVNFGIALNRIVDFQLFVHPDFTNNDPNQPAGSVPMRLLPYATPSTWIGADLSGFNYSLKNNTLCLLKSANGNAFASSQWNASVKFTSTAVSRGWIKFDYISAQCGDAVSGYVFNSIFNSASYPGHATDCAGGANGDFLIQSSGMGLGSNNSGKEDDISLYSASSSSGNLRITATLDQVERTNTNAIFGITFRQSTAYNATHASVMITPSAGVWGMSRQASGNGTGTASISGVKTPVKVRLTKTGTTFKHEYFNSSSNAWVQIGGVFPISSFTGNYRYGFIGASKANSLWMTGSGTTIQVETVF